MDQDSPSKRVMPSFPSALLFVSSAATTRCPNISWSLKSRRASAASVSTSLRLSFCCLIHFSAVDAMCFIANQAARSKLSSFWNDFDSCSEVRDISAGGRKCRHSANRSGGRVVRWAALALAWVGVGVGVGREDMMVNGSGVLRMKSGNCRSIVMIHSYTFRLRWRLLRRRPRMIQQTS